MLTKLFTTLLLTVLVISGCAAYHSGEQAVSRLQQFVSHQIVN